VQGQYRPRRREEKSYTLTGKPRKRIRSGRAELRKREGLFLDVSRKKEDFLRTSSKKSPSQWHSGKRVKENTKDDSFSSHLRKKKHTIGIEGGKP